MADDPVDSGSPSPLAEAGKQAYESFSRQQASASHALESANKLSKVSQEQLTESVRKALESTTKLTRAQLEEAKGIADLISLLSKLEDKLGSYTKLEEKREKIKAAAFIEEMKRVGDAEKAEKRAIEIADKAIKSEKEFLDLRFQEIKNLKDKIQLEVKSLEQGDQLNKHFDGLNDGLKDSIIGFFTLKKTAEHLKKAFELTYNELGSLSGKGLLGSFSAINIAAMKLQVLPEEFEKLIDANRDLVMTLGGGTKGVNAFADTVAEAREGLEYLGKDASKAASRFVTTLNNIGLTRNDGKAYKDALANLKSVSKEFAGMFGDNADVFAKLFEDLTNDETTRRRLNILNKDQLRDELKAQMVRAENLKMLGLSNEQLDSFNKRTGDLFNPRHENFAERRSHSVAAQNTTNMLLGMTSGTTEGAELQRHMATLNEYWTRMGASDMTPGEMNKRNQDPKVIAALEAFHKAGQSVYSKGVHGQGVQAWNSEFLNKMLNQSGMHMKLPEDIGEAAALATRQERNWGPNQKAHAVGGVQGGWEENLLRVLTRLDTTLNTLTSSSLGQLAISAASFAGLIWFLKGGGGTVLKMLGSLMSTGGTSMAMGGLAKAVPMVGATLGVGASAYSLYSGLTGKSDDDYQREKKASDKSMGMWGLGGAAVGAIIGGLFGNIPGALWGASIGSGVGMAIGGIGSSSSSSGPSTSAPASGGFNMGAYAQTMGNRENSGRYGGTGGDRNMYLGKYQMGNKALIEAGFVRPGTSLAGLDDPSNWLIGNKQTYLASPDLQDQAFQAFTNKNIQQGMSAGVLTSLSTPADIAAFAGAAHLGGAPNTINMMRGGPNYRDSNGTAMSTYANMSAASQGGGATSVATSQGINPTVELLKNANQHLAQIASNTRSRSSSMPAKVGVAEAVGRAG